MDLPQGRNKYRGIKKILPLGGVPKNEAKGVNA
jgi:hypothetical protein